MSWIRSKLESLKDLRSRFGAAQTLTHAVFRLVNKVFCFDCLQIIVLDRDNLKPLDPAKTHRLSAKLATLEDLREMEQQECWRIDEKKIECFNNGDACLLSYVDDKLAGYTWAHANGHPELIAGLQLTVPREYLYNFDGFTLPDFRGHGLQPFRHRELLNHPRWRNRKGLLGYVIHTNHRSKRGQGKSGYETIGNIRVIGGRSHFLAFIGKTLRSMGIKRIRAAARQSK